MKTSWLHALLSALAMIVVTASGASAQLSTTHYLAPMAPYSDSQVVLEISTPSTSAVTYTVHNGFGALIEEGATIPQISGSVVAGSPQRHTLDRDGTNDDTSGMLGRDNVRAATVESGYGIVVESSEPVIVVMYMLRSNNQDAVVSKGTNGLGTTFYPSSEFNNYAATTTVGNNDHAHFVSVMAVEDDTDVVIDNPSAIFDGYAPGTTVTLDAFETFTVQTSGNQTILGTEVSADRPVTVVAGNVHSGQSGAGALDAVIDQLVPVDLAGADYVVANIANYSSYGPNGDDGTPVGNRYINLVGAVSGTTIVDQFAAGAAFGGAPLASFTLTGPGDTATVARTGTAGTGYYFRSRPDGMGEARPFFAYLVGSGDAGSELGGAILPALRGQGSRGPFCSGFEYVDVIQPVGTQAFMVYVRTSDLASLEVDDNTGVFVPYTALAPTTTTIQSQSDAGESITALRFTRSFLSDGNRITFRASGRMHVSFGAVDGGTGLFGFVSDYNFDMLVLDPTTALPSDDYDAPETDTPAEQTPRRVTHCVDVDSVCSEYWNITSISAAEGSLTDVTTTNTTMPGVDPCFTFTPNPVSGGTPTEYVISARVESEVGNSRDVQVHFYFDWGNDDGDDVPNALDIDTDDDGLLDTEETTFAFAGDPDFDSDFDGVPDWNDPNTGAMYCTPGGVMPFTCVAGSLPTSVDFDGDGVPNHLDRDSDGDGITDALETGATDEDADGVLDACVSHAADGSCLDAGGMSLTVMMPRNSDMMGEADYLDLDSDGDGLLDFDEAFDTDGDGGADTTAVGNDHDGDGIDDRFDPDCPGGACMGGGLAITLTGGAYDASSQDEDGDGTPDWLELCGDAYVTGTEACDDGGASAACTAACLREVGQNCTGSGQCDTGICDAASMSCQSCTDDSAGGTDTGCMAPNAACIPGMPNSCGACTVDADCAVGEACLANTCLTPGLTVSSPSGVISTTTTTPSGTSTNVPMGTTISVTVTGDGGPFMCTGMVGAGGAWSCGAGAITGLLAGRDYSLLASTTVGTIMPSAMGAFSTAVCADLLLGEACSDTRGGAAVMGFCDGDGAMAACVACANDETGAAVDAGCAAGAPLCVDVMGAPTCVACADDSMGGTDVGCSAMAPACDESNPAVPVCLTCEDTGAPGVMDNGCADAAAPYCLTGAMMAPSCVECLRDADCPAMGEVCGSANSCVSGCDEASDCEGTATPVCDFGARTCVECLMDDQCPGVTTCSAVNTCVFPDSDMDGVRDDEDLDDDNDGIPDLREVSALVLADSDMDGVLDYEDPEVGGTTRCADGDMNGVCDALPLDVDFDGDGIANHLDRDADGDGVDDLVEAGGIDADGDGIVDGFADANGDGIDDALGAIPLTNPDTDSDTRPDFLDLDSDGDGLTDLLEAATTDLDDDGVQARIDLDSDGDGIGDLIEANDADADGAADRTPVGFDTDNDGLDDAFDPDCVLDTDCAGTIGIPPEQPDRDADTRPDWIDIDSDGDGIRDVLECPIENACIDTDEDGIPNYLDTDSDGDGGPDAVEAFDDDHDGVPSAAAADRDTDGDGLDDAYDPDCTPGVCEFVEMGVEPSLPDLDMDLAPNHLDRDDDGDGIPSATEREDARDYEGPAALGGDVDEDGLPNWYDTDSDGDAVSDMSEDTRPELDGDLDDNGILDYLDPEYSPEDTDRDGVVDAYECPDVMPPDATCPDSDGDGVPDFQDVDDDGDGILTRVEYPLDGDDGDPVSDHDFDDDGVPNHLDLDSDGDGIPDLRENRGFALDADGDGRIDTATDADGDGLDAAFDADDDDANNTLTGLPLDTDGDGVQDFISYDADGDGLSDIFEAGGTDADGDGRFDMSADANMDGLADAAASSPLPAPDTDEDGARDFQDADDDGDGIDTRFEDVDGDGDLGNDDTDGDGTPNYLDPDDDGDGTPTADEQPDPNGDGDPADAIDTDENGTPDYLQSLPESFGLAGGACSAGGDTPPSWLGIMFIALILRRRRRGDEVSSRL